MPFRIPLFNPSPVKNCFANFGVDTFTIMFALSEKQKYGDTYNIKNINMWIPVGRPNINIPTNDSLKVQGEQSERVLAVILSVVCVRCMYVP